MGALTAAVAAASELGRAEELNGFVSELGALKLTLAEGHSRALAAWSLGNGAFTAGDIPSGLREHDEAARLLRPEADLRAWARFCKATAAMRLAAGILDGVDALITRASHGLAIVGNSADLAELELLRAERLSSEDPRRSAEIITRVLDDEQLPGQTVGYAHRIRARALISLNELEQATDALLQAALAYVESGAAEKASETWQALMELRQESHETGTRSSEGPPHLSHSRG